MYYSIRGILIKKEAGLAVIEANGLAFQLTISDTTYTTLPIRGNECKLFTYLHVREDIMQLFGFNEGDEKELFLKLISLSGIGPKNAMNILSAISVYEFKKTILNGDINRLKSLPGIGPKTAKRLLLELKDKISDEELSGVISGNSLGVPDRQTADILAALESLGYRKSEVQRTTEKILSENPGISTEDCIRRILKSKNIN
ncbi:MAG: Holliday junction branch migration protein RuvA [Candidatus Marinimicrobia bacterium]|nr:Holliday junction branch migration protein RuvA [Candidatus Neomarinimicrobiota bacterium]